MTNVELIHAIYSIYSTEDAALSLITVNYLSFKIRERSGLLVDVCIQVATLECSRDSDGHDSAEDAFTRGISARLHRYYADKLGRTDD